MVSQHQSGDRVKVDFPGPNRMNIRIGVTMLCVVLLFGTLFAQPPTFRYFYDDAHRLFRVLDNTGTLLEYVYDRSGNILGINRSNVAPASVAVLNMTPLLTG